MNKQGDLAWTADDIRREYGDTFLRELEVELAAPPRSAAFDWAEPGDGPLTKLAPAGEPPRNLHLRANPLPRQKWPTHLKSWQEELLVIWWRADLAEHALTALVESHRPMVVSMARRLNQRHLALLVEYGMLGLRIAATQQRPSKTKKGKMAGFDPAKARFSTYSRRVARRFMAAAEQAMGGVVIVKGLRLVDDAIVITGDYFNECLGPRFEDRKEEFDAWARTPIPLEVEQRANYVERTDEEIAELLPKVAMVNYDDFKLLALPSLGSRYEPLPGYI
jgi:hypothetical protein